MFFFTDLFFFFLYFFLLREILEKKSKRLEDLCKVCSFLKQKGELKTSDFSSEKKLFELWKECQIRSLPFLQKISFLKNLFLRLEKLPRKRRQRQLTLFSRFMFFTGFCFLSSFVLRSFFLKHPDPLFFEKERSFFLLLGAVFVFLFVLVFKFLEKKSSFFEKEFSPEFSFWLESYFLGFSLEGGSQKSIFVEDFKEALLTGSFYQEEGKKTLEDWILEKLEQDNFKQKRSFEFSPLFEVVFYLIISASFFLPYMSSWSLLLEF